jgi:hypothetical protein
MSEKIQVVTDLPKPSFLTRVPLKKIALVALVAASAVVIAGAAKEALSETENAETIEA